MKAIHRLLVPLAAALLLSGLLAEPARAAESLRVRVILVEAGNNGEPGVDSALRPYAETLQRLFRFASYRQLSRAGLRMEVPGEDSTGLAGGQSLTLRATQKAGPGVMAELTWTRGSQRLLHTKLQLRPGSPAVLGGPRTGKGEGSYLLILVME